MIKRIWTFKRIILAIITFMCTIIVAVSLQKSIMGTDRLERDFGVAFLFIVVLVCFLYFLYKLLIPKSFRCMTVVKKYLSFRELKDRINNKSFSKIVIDEKKPGKDSAHSGGISSGLTLPDTDEFDLLVPLSLTTKLNNHVRQLLRDKNRYRHLTAAAGFDYLPAANRKHDPTVFYELPFRIVRFRIADGLYETVVTNLDAQDFPASELKKLYNMRWGIETSFRKLKYTVGLLHFHAKKVEYIYQEVFARLVMYNFTELVTLPVIVQKADAKYAYKANFTVAVHVCRQFLLGNVSPPDVEALIRRHFSPIRPGRSRPRKMTAKHAVSFIYRVA